MIPDRRECFRKTVTVGGILYQELHSKVNTSIHTVTSLVPYMLQSTEVGIMFSTAHNEI